MPTYEIIVMYKNEFEGWKPTHEGKFKSRRLALEKAAKEALLYGAEKVSDELWDGPNAFVIIDEDIAD